MELRPFDPYVVCPGCGYVPSSGVGAPTLRYCVGACAPIDLGGVVEQTVGRAGRHVHQICPRCGYEDLMVCAPAPPRRRSADWLPGVAEPARALEPLDPSEAQRVLDEGWRRLVPRAGESITLAWPARPHDRAVYRLLKATRSPAGQLVLEFA